MVDDHRSYNKRFDQHQELQRLQISDPVSLKS